MSGVTNYPHASINELRRQHIGRLLEEVDNGPIAVVDKAITRRNCQLMLEACEYLGVPFRSHVKTHKTTEITKYQVGEKSDTIRLVCSTLAEIEQLRPWLEESKANGKIIDIIYGLPVQPSCFKRLAELGRALGDNSISVLVDCEDILPHLDRYHELSGGHRLGVYSKLETGNNRAGLSYNSEELKALLTAIHRKETSDPSKISLLGFYSHQGTSYNADSTNEALDYLADELERCADPTEWTRNLYADGRRLTVTVGATPTATSAQNLVTPETPDPSVKRVRDLIARLKQTVNVEIHAGAYVFLDMQLMAAHARPAEKHRDFKDIAFTIVAEIASLYPHRSPPEALMACGNLSLARETCRTYSGFGVMTPWDPAHRDQQWSFYDPQKDCTGWVVSRISQEHGILTWNGPVEQKRPLEVGQKVRLWTNHCCIAAAAFHFFLIVDSDQEGVEKDRIIDVWHSWRGW